MIQIFCEDFIIIIIIIIIIIMQFMLTLIFQVV